MRNRFFTFCGSLVLAGSIFLSACNSTIAPAPQAPASSGQHTDNSVMTINSKSDADDSIRVNIGGDDALVNAQRGAKVHRQTPIQTKGGQALAEALARQVNAQAAAQEIQNEKSREASK